MTQALVGFDKLGKSFAGKDADGTLINTDKVGTIVRFATFQATATQRGNKTRPGAGLEITAILLRNVSGGALLGKRLGLLSSVAGYTPAWEVINYTTVHANKLAVLIDPWLSSDGVADDDLFWGIIGGPAVILTPIAGADFKGDIAVNAQLVAATGTTTGATTSGRISQISIANATDAQGAIDQALAVLGRALSARTTGETAADLLVYWNNRNFAHA